MRALIQQAYGAPADVVRLEERPEPQPGAGQVRVRMKAAPILPMDHLLLRGMYPLRRDLPAIAGAVGCGDIDAVGPNVEGLSEGDRVLLPVRQGSWADAVLAPAVGVTRLEGSPDPLRASSVVVDGLTAVALLDGLKRGDWVLQNPGGGGVGRQVLEVARRMGVRTISVVRRAEQGPSLAGDVVLVDGPDLGARVREALGGEPIHRALDGVGGPATEVLGGCLSDGGRVLHYGAMSRMGPRLAVADAIFRGVLLQGFWLYRLNRLRGRGETQQLQRQVVQADLPVEIGGLFGLEDVHEALALSRNPVRQGRVFLVPDPAPLPAVGDA